MEKKLHTIEIKKLSTQILLQNEPILNNIEKALQIPSRTLQFKEKRFICCEDQRILNLSITLLKNELAKYVMTIVKTQLEGNTDIQTLLTYYLTIRFRFPSLADLSFSFLSEDQNKRTAEFLVYGKKQNAIDKFKSIIGKDSVMIFEDYERLQLLPSIAHKHYFNIFNMIDEMNLTTIPQEFEEGMAPIVYGNRKQINEFKKNIDKLEKEMFETLILKPKRVITKLERNYFDEKFEEMIAQILKSIPCYLVIFKQEKNKSYQVTLQVEKQFAQNMFILLMAFFDGIQMFTIKEDVTDDDVLIYNDEMLKNPPPMNSFCRKLLNKKTNKNDFVCSQKIF